MGAYTRPGQEQRLLFQVLQQHYMAFRRCQVLLLLRKKEHTNVALILVIKGFGSLGQIAAITSLCFRMSATAMVAHGSSLIP